MKYFTLILFLFSAIILNAQINMEEISYIPSPSGYYNNLIVKGNSNIKNLYTFSFNVQSYASFLDLKLKDTNKMFIKNITISTGTAVLFSEVPSSNINNWQMNPEEGNRNESDIPTIVMHGGNLSIDKTNNLNVELKISHIEFPQHPNSASTTFDVRTQDSNYDYRNLGYDPNQNSQLGLSANNVYILGMKVPDCEHGYYWQPIKASNNIDFTVLACSTNSCKNPQIEEMCLQAGKRFSSTPDANGNCGCIN